MSDITVILDKVRRGERHATDDLLRVAYEELRRLAAGKLVRERAGHTLQATELVHEAYMRLLGGESPQWENRAHFFGAVTEAMRRILVEAARRRGRLKHGGGLRRQPLDEADAIVTSDAVDLVALDEALQKLAREDPRKAELVKLRYFGGLTVEQAAELLGISRATADRYWTFARTWLYNEVTRDDTRS
jgi:RNA polymerase sigma factor (TIGR02999 family)